MAFPGEALSSGMGISKELIGGVTGTAVVISSAFKAFKRVPQGEMGVRMRFGKVRLDKNDEPKVVGPGLHGVPPFTHSIETISVQDRSHDLGNFAIERAGVKYDVKSSITWAVSEEKEHVRRALFKATGLTEMVTNICGSGLRFIMTTAEDSEFDNQHSITEGVHEVCDEDLLVYGVLLKNLQIREIARNDAQVLADAIRGTRDSTRNIATLAAVLPQAVAGA